MRFGYVARVSRWVWLGLFVAIAIVNAAVDHYYTVRPSRLSLNLRVASQVDRGDLAIYLTGWGPVLWAAYIFVALENLARAGSRVWRTTVLCSLIGMTVGQFALARGWLPSELTKSEAASLTVMGAFVLFFVIRMAGAIMEQNETAMEQKEEAETTLRLSEDRFRSLIQNSSDVTMILGEQRRVPLRVPGDHGPPAVRAGASSSAVSPPTSSIPRTSMPCSRCSAEVTSSRGRDGDPRVPHAAPGRHEPGRGSRGVEPDGPPLGGRVRRQHPRRHGAQEVRGPPGASAPCTIR